MTSITPRAQLIFDACKLRPLRDALQGLNRRSAWHDQGWGRGYRTVVRADAGPFDPLRTESWAFTVLPDALENFPFDALRCNAVCVVRQRGGTVANVRFNVFARHFRAAVMQTVIVVGAKKRPPKSVMLMLALTKGCTS